MNNSMNACGLRALTGLTLAFFLSATGAAPASAAGAEHAKVNVEAHTDGDHLQLKFVVAPSPGLHINMEGPWKLELQAHDSLTFAKAAYGKADMDEKLPGFVVATTAKPAAASGEVAYSLIAFVCTDDKTQCFRDVHTGKAPWKAAGK